MGVYRSVDGGDSWKHLGLKETERIKRIVVDPNNPDVACVCALGKNGDPIKKGGFFKTTDGGKTWDKILYIDENTVVQISLWKMKIQELCMPECGPLEESLGALTMGAKYSHIQNDRWRGNMGKNYEWTSQTDMARPGIHIAQSNPILFIS